MTSQIPIGGIDEDGQRRPKKRLKLLHDDRDVTNTMRLKSRLVIEELDLEISLRQRLLQTAQSRITWALLLQEALESEFKAPSFGSEPDFKAAAEDALTAIEAPCSVLFNREVTYPSEPLFLIPPSEQTTPIVPEVLPEPSSIATRQGALRTRIRARVPLQPVKKLLFLRYNHTTPPTIAKLACPDCARSDFSNLQGLLNHCRLRHQREFGSHDECVQSCAVLVPEDERDIVATSGTELKGITLPSLRRLFEIAVGASDAASLPLPRGSPADQGLIAQNIKETNSQREGAHLTRTLGHHLDTPALAPYLGRVPQKRFIHVHEDSEVVDIFDVSTPGSSLALPRKGKWRMPYSHRNIARAELDEEISPSNVGSNGKAQGATVPLPTSSSKEPDDDRPGTHPDGLSRADTMPNFQSLAGSRFHIAARVTIADYSLWQPPERRPESTQDQTHLWRLSVSSPSYSLHITSILAKLTVQCITDPPPPTFLEPLTITEPPFIVTGVTDRPFLARLSFTWADARNAPMDVDHWVELDPVHSSTPVLGDEQVFDIELDRYTELLPIREDREDVTWDNPLLTSRQRSSIRAADQTPNASSESDYTTVLKSLLPQVPMTMKDVKGRARMNLPYTLVSSPAHFQSLVLGRRKAIEMGRARALWDAYQKLLEAHPQQDAVPLTVVDIYRWLEDEQLFPRGNVEQPSSSSHTSRRNKEPVTAVADAFCARCGLQKLYHPAPVKAEDSGTVDTQAPTAIPLALDTLTSPCVAFVNAMSLPPLLDVKYFLGSSTAADGSSWSPYALSPAIFTSPSGANALRVSSSDLVECADPSLVLSIRGLVRRWNLNCLPSDLDNLSEEATLAVRTAMHRPRQESCDRIAPYAMLALLTRSIVKVLLRRGLESFRQDETSSRLLERQDRSRRRMGPVSGMPSMTRRLLIPSHIFRGLASAAQSEVRESGVLITLARLGESVNSEVAIEIDTTRPGHRETSGEVRDLYDCTSAEAVIKTEET